MEGEKEGEEENGVKGIDVVEMRIVLAVSASLLLYFLQRVVCCIIRRLLIIILRPYQFSFSPTGQT